MNQELGRLEATLRDLKMRNEDLEANGCHHGISYVYRGPGTRRSWHG